MVADVDVAADAGVVADAGVADAVAVAADVDAADAAIETAGSAAAAAEFGCRLFRPCSSAFVGGGRCSECSGTILLISLFR